MRFSSLDELLELRHVEMFACSLRTFLGCFLCNLSISNLWCFLGLNLEVLAGISAWFNFIAHTVYNVAIGLHFLATGGVVVLVGASILYLSRIAVSVVVNKRDILLDLWRLRHRHKPSALRSLW